MTRKCAWAGAAMWASLALSAAFRSRYNGLFLAAAFGIAVLAYFTFDKYRRHTVVCFVFFALGIASNSAYTHFVYDKLISYDGEVLTLTGHITEISQLDGDFDRVTVSTKIDGISTDISYVVRNGDYRYYDEITVTSEVDRINNTLKFDSESYYYSKSVFLQGEYDAEYSLSGRNTNPLMRSIKEYRDRLFVLINQQAQGREGAFLSAMLCGDKSEMSPAMKTAMYRSGLGHIFAVSGVHLVILTAVFGYIADKLIKIRKLRTALILVQIWGFALFAGMSVSVVRAAVMLTLSQSSYLFGRKSDTPNSLGLCTILMCTFRPYSAISPSFMLSFLAVAGLYASSFIYDRKKDNDPLTALILKPVAGSLGVLFFTAPVCAVIFGGVSPLSIVSNILLIPLCVIALELCFLVLLTGGALFIAGPLLLLARLIIKPVLWAAFALAEMHYGFLPVNSSVMMGIVVVTSIAAVIFMLVKSVNKRFAAFGLVMVVLWSGCADISKLLDTDLTVAIFPDKNGTEYVFSRKGRAVIFDVGCGGSMNSVVQRLSQERGFNAIDYVYIFGRSGPSAWIEDDIFLQPKYIFVTEKSKSVKNDHLKDKLVVLSKGTADIGMICITVTKDGYTVSSKNAVFQLNKHSITVNGEEYTLEKGYAYETDDISASMRRFENGFN